MQRSFFVLIRLFCLFIFVSACVSFTFAQDSAVEQEINSTSETSSVSRKQDDSDDSDKKNELTMLAAFAPDMPTPFGGARESSFMEVAFRYSRVLAANDNLALKYHIDAIPFAMIAYKRELFYQSGPNSFFALHPGSKSYAFGVTPVGFQLNFRRKAKVQPFLTAEAGLLIFNKPIPDDRTSLFPNRAGKNLNFTLAGGGGLEFPTNSGRSYILGFKFHHISNASTGNINPGFDQNLFYFGYTFKKW
jgi:hypothetical protein